MSADARQQHHRQQHGWQQALDGVNALMQHTAHQVHNAVHGGVLHLQRAGQGAQRWAASLSQHPQAAAIAASQPQVAQGASFVLRQPGRHPGQAHEHTHPLHMALPLATMSSSSGLAAEAARMTASHPVEDLSAAKKAELGRATWTLLHTLAAQYPDKPTRHQRRDVKQFIECLTRIYPCASCASHFQDIVKRHPPDVNSGPELRAWTCRVHNVVNRSLGKPEFNCDIVAARWAPLECGPEGQAANGCDMTVGRRRK